MPPACGPGPPETARRAQGTRLELNGRLDEWSSPRRRTGRLVAGPGRGAANGVWMRTRTLGSALVLPLTLASTALQMTPPNGAGSRFVTIVLQAATLVAAVRV